jgi:acetylornithine deacetylase
MAGSATLEDTLAALVAERPTLGNEEGAQQLIAARLEAAGFKVTRIQPDAEAALADPAAGYPSLPYEGRSSVVGVLHGTGGGRSLHLSGHIDVVPVDPDAPWSHDPWAGEIADGRMWGRGAGDMKGGLAAYLHAAEAVAAGGPHRGDLIFSSVIEEECGGNGMWSVVRAGYTADATLVGEPSGLDLIHACTGVVWLRLIAHGPTGHAAFTGGDGPFDALARAVAALRGLEAAQNSPPRDAIFAAVSSWPYGMTVGRIAGGVWTASAPARLEVQVRFGIGLDVDPADLQARMRSVVSPDVEIVFEAFRARAYCWDTAAELADMLQPAPFRAWTATTDARYVEGALCYGPTAGNLHGADEWVDLASVEQCSQVVAATAARWLA